ncbi:redoxin domain-containing protein [Halomarina oriensis]|uniref:Redoxin domain-containing protein n=1 Tax=Halomarina oriensis TaxID=671145 RepID=A0A6B0GMJ6_9EURY|nr:redoxin domain-containing protein [Halomarina oriensis]MWG36136.1 redoxin domain-containing protein [Halomarina oriensis]
MQVGDTAPEFTAPLATGEDVESFTLSDALEDGPVVLAFFPGAFTSVCSHEMATFRDRLDEFRASDASVYGISTDLPFALNAFHDELDLNFPLISDANRELVHQYDVSTEFAGIEDAARRAVFVVGADGVVDYAWVGENPGVEPEYDEVEAAAADA